MEINNNDHCLLNMESLSEDEWFVEMTMNIHQLRALYSVINFAHESWPGAPRRPLEEQEYLRNMKSKLFAMILEYNVSNK